MKKIKLYFLTLLTMLSFTSCEQDNNDELTNDAETGGLLNNISPLVPYVVGNGNTYQYKAKFDVFQGVLKTTQVNIYKSFVDVNGVKSNEVLFKTINVPSAPQAQVTNLQFTYNELIAGLILNGSPLPASDALLNIGDAWVLRYVSNVSDGKVHQNTKTTKVSVGTRFAGTYKVIVGEYWRIGVYRPDVAWVGETRVIESVNATTYKFLEYAGPFVGVANTHYFTINAMDVVHTPQTYNGSAQLFNGNPATNCVDNPTTMTNACGWAGLQNTVFRDNVNGKDRIYRTYGYFTSGSGPREIYEVLEKVVN